MKKIYSVTVLFVSAFTFIISSCATPASIVAKSGAQLWGENCQRCHILPSPESFDSHDWSIVGTHMKIKAGLTETEEEKIVTFLKSSK